MSFTRFASSVALTCAALAVALPGCSSDQPEPGVGNVDMAVTLATPPAGPNEQIDSVEVSFWCDGVDPVLGVPRPPQSAPEIFTVNTSTSQGSEPKNTIGLFEKQGIPAGNCEFTFSAVSNTGNTECNGEITVAVVTNETTSFEVVLACIHTPRYGGVRGDGTFNQCAEYRQILVTPTTQSVGNLVDVRTEVYDPDGDPVTVAVQTAGVCGNVATVGSDTAASCLTVSGCEAVVNTVECTGVGLCEIIVAVSDDGFDSCTGLLPDGSNNNAARQTIAVDCAEPAGCGNGILEPGEDCDPPDGVFCDNNCQFIDPCASDPCNQSNVCSPEVCTADPGDNSAICTPDPGSASGNACSPPAGGVCDGEGNCVTCTVDEQCPDDGNECTAEVCNAGSCESVNVPDGTECNNGAGSCQAGTCESGLVCEYEQDFEAMVPGDPPQPCRTRCPTMDGWSARTCSTDGTTFMYDYFAFSAPTRWRRILCSRCRGRWSRTRCTTTVDLQRLQQRGHEVSRIDRSHRIPERTIVASDARDDPHVPVRCEGRQHRGRVDRVGVRQDHRSKRGFATTNNVTQDTTNLPTSWGTFTITLLVDPALVGQILQYGFRPGRRTSKASGNFYDNISLCTEAPGGGCSVDADCPDTGNDCTAGACVRRKL